MSPAVQSVASRADPPPSLRRSCATPRSTIHHHTRRHEAHESTYKGCRPPALHAEPVFRACAGARGRTSNGERTGHDNSAECEIASDCRGQKCDNDQPRRYASHHLSLGLRHAVNRSERCEHVSAAATLRRELPDASPLNLGARSTKLTATPATRKGHLTKLGSAAMRPHDPSPAHDRPVALSAATRVRWPRLAAGRQSAASRA